MTSEERFEIIKQPEPTCPMIDHLIRQANDLIKILRGYERADEEELRSMADEVDSSIRYFEDELNYIRKNAESIRNWGQGWKDAALRFEETLEKEHEQAD